MKRGTFLNQNIFGFDISVSNFSVVQKNQSRTNIAHDPPCVQLRETPLYKNIYMLKISSLGSKIIIQGPNNSKFLYPILKLSEVLTPALDCFDRYIKYWIDYTIYNILYIFTLLSSFSFFHVLLKSRFVKNNALPWKKFWSRRLISNFWCYQM